MTREYARSGIAEELRHYLVGQLNIISGLLEVLQADCGESLAAEHKEYLEAMQSAANKALAALPPRVDRIESATGPAGADFER